MIVNYSKMQGNAILSSLSQEELKSISPYLELVPIGIGERLAEAGQEMNYVYFPVSGIISFLYVLENKSTAEVGLVGRENFFGIHVLFGGKKTPYDVVIQGKGEAYRLPKDRFMELFSSSATFRNTLLLLCQVFITQIFQTAVCNKHHSIEQQLCRWLLLLLDRVDDARLNMTQEVIAMMLGVRKEGVSEATKSLHEEGIIKYHYGLIHVLDRRGLEQLTCECYSVVRDEHERLFPKGENFTNRKILN